jgi:hypothetical protein
MHRTLSSNSSISSSKEVNKDPIRIRERLVQLDPVVCHALGLHEEEGVTLPLLRKRLIQGYTRPYRDRIYPLLEVLDYAQEYPQEESRIGRRALDSLLNCEIDIHGFIRHPLSYGCRMPYYLNVVHEVMYLEKVIERFEMERTETLAQDVHILFQNFVDYHRVNPSSHRVCCKVKDMYQTFGTFFHGPPPPPLLEDGMTERFRKTGECFETLCALTVAAQQDRLKAYEARCIQRLTERYIHRKSPRMTELSKREQHVQEEAQRRRIHELAMRQKHASDKSERLRERRDIFESRTKNLMQRWEERVHDLQT